jgi:predicted metal-dependent phosphoesterase TrpH
MSGTRRRFLRGMVAGAGAAAAVAGSTAVGRPAAQRLASFGARPQPAARTTDPFGSLRHGPQVRDPYWGADLLPWWKGQLHTHTARSFDGDPNVPPARRATLYQLAGYDFVVLTDHDRVSALPGSGLVEAAGGAQRPVLIIPGVESTDPSAHLGVWFIGPDAAPAAVDPPLVAARRAPAERIEAWAAMGALVCCNHPSHPSAPLSAEQVASWAGGGVPFRFVEVFNTLATRSAEGLAHNLEVWRRAVTAAGPERPVWAVATDDSHQPAVGQSWIAVAAPSLSAGALREALLAGRFYASNGPDVSALGVDEEAGAIVASAPGATTIRFVGDDGATRRQVAGETGWYRPQRGDRWVRVEAVDGAGRMAWSQPFWLDA